MHLPTTRLRTREGPRGAGRGAASAELSVSTVIAPDVFEPIVGFREWVVLGDELLSPLARTAWEDEPMQARCLPSCHGAWGLWGLPCEHDGPAPDPGCVCGIYAMFDADLGRRRDRLSRVAGAVVVWGRLEVHEAGMRAQFARIVALALPESRRGGPERMVARIAGRLGVPAVPARRLEAAALAYGQRLPGVLMPS